MPVRVPKKPTNLSGKEAKKLPVRVQPNIPAPDPPRNPLQESQRQNKYKGKELTDSFQYKLHLTSSRTVVMSNSAFR
jgi:hypothetical protein